MVIKRMFWIVFVLFALLMGIYPFVLYALKIPFGITSIKPALTMLRIGWRIPFHVHIVAGAIAISIGWIQFLKNWRQRNLSFHRKLGMFYLFSVVVSSLSGIVISFDANGGMSSFLALFMASLFWLVVTVMAYYYVVKQRIGLHRKLMIYSYALTFAGVTLRIWLPTLAIALNDFERAYDLATWLAWLVNLAVALYINEKSRVGSDKINRKSTSLKSKSFRS